jgi:hypothetical protein
MKEEILRFRRQFLISRSSISNLSHWNCLLLRNQYQVYSHPDLEVAVHEQSNRKAVLLGYIFDPIHPEKRNEDILATIMNESDTFVSFIQAIKYYAGRYVFIYMDDNSFNVIHDPLAIREVYYATAQNRVVCGSQPNLLAEFSAPRLDETSNPDIQNFYEYDMKKVRLGKFWVGDETFYSGVNHLLPNHYFDIANMRAKRYWPNQKLESIELNEAVERSCSFLQGIMKAASARYSLMMAVTSGTDSRTLLAASKDVKNKIYFFINKESPLSNKHPDIKIPCGIFKILGIPFHVHSVEGEVDKCFKEIFLNNTFMANDRILSTIYNVYFKHHHEKLNILGVGEIGRGFFGAEPQGLDGFYLARSLKYKYSPYAVNQCEKWLEAVRPVARACGVNIMTLLLWEQLLGNWGAVGNSESDIAIEEFDPYNSHYLYETFLSVDKKHAARGGRFLFELMIKRMWPELLSFPINPPYKASGYLKLVLKKLKLEKIIRELIYRYDRIKYESRIRAH